MSKISYPMNGLKTSVYSELEQAKNGLLKASSNFVSGPSTYSSSNYVEKLPSMLINFQTWLDSIMDAIVDVTNIYTELEENLNVIHKNVSSPTLKVRERLIK